MNLQDADPRPASPARAALGILCGCAIAAFAAVPLMAAVTASAVAPSDADPAFLALSLVAALFGLCAACTAAGRLRDFLWPEA